jgi:ribonuclease PH
VGVDASEPAIRATSTSARLVRWTIRGTGAHGPYEFRRAVGRSHLSSVHLHDYSCQIVDNIDCHNKQEE